MKKSDLTEMGTNSKQTIAELIQKTLKTPDTVFFVTIDRTQEGGKEVSKEVTVEIRPAQDAIAIADQINQSQKSIGSRRTQSI
jgi:hypothetical protein